MFGFPENSATWIAAGSCAAGFLLIGFVAWRHRHLFKSYEPRGKRAEDIAHFKEAIHDYKPLEH